MARMTQEERSELGRRAARARIIRTPEEAKVTVEEVVAATMDVQRGLTHDVRCRCLACQMRKGK